MADSPSTRKAKQSAHNKFLRFCYQLNISHRELPDQHRLMLFATWCANCPNEPPLEAESIRCYVSHLRSYFSSLGLSLRTDAEAMPELHKLLRGIKRDQTKKPKRKQPLLPITPEILLQFRSLLNFKQQKDRALWTAILLGFYSFLRSNNLVPRSHQLDENSRHLTWNDIKFKSYGADLTIHTSKTNQLGHFHHIIPIPAIPDSPLCPIQALLALGQYKDNAPLFSYNKRSFINYNDLHMGLKELAKRANLPNQYDTHSLRKGGASYASACGATIEQIKLQGDWRSDAVLTYIHVPWSTRLELLFIFSNNINQLR